MQLFLDLQVLDFLTTMVGLRLGLSEVNFFIRWLMGAGTVLGALLSKLMAIGPPGFCLWIQRRRRIQWVNYWQAALMVWNLSIIWVRPRAPEPMAGAPAAYYTGVRCARC